MPLDEACGDRSYGYTQERDCCCFPDFLDIGVLMESSFWRRSKLEEQACN